MSDWDQYYTTTTIHSESVPKLQWPVKSTTHVKYLNIIDPILCNGVMT
jgi:hypothetical protein